jgi:hypothetical protein
MIIPLYIIKSSKAYVYFGALDSSPAYFLLSVLVFELSNTLNVVKLMRDEVFIVSCCGRRSLLSRMENNFSDVTDAKIKPQALV